MALINFTGFESGANGAYEIDAVQGDSEMQNTTKKSGSFAFKIFPVTTSTGYIDVRGIDSVGTTQAMNVATIYTSFDFYYTTKPSSGSEPIFRAFEDTGGTSKFSIRLDSNGKLNIYNTSGTQIGSAGSTTLSASTWYKISVKVGTGGSGAYEVKINDTSEFSGTANLNSNNNVRVTLGKYVNVSGESITAYYDNVILDDAQFYDGDVEILPIVPTANSADFTWTSGTNSSDYNEVKGVPYSDSTYVQNSATGDATFTMTTCSTAGISGTIHGVKLSTRTRENASGTSSILSCYIKVNSSTQNTGARNGTTTIDPRSYISTTNPDGGGAWTTTTLDTAKMGTRQGNSLACRLTSVIAQVLFTPPTSVDYPITASQGSITLTGQASLLKIGIKLLAVYGSLSLSGQSSLLKIGTKMLSSFGSFVLSGQSNLLRYGRTIVSSLGTFVLSGQSNLLKLGVKMLSDFGSFVLSGQNALLKIGNKMVASFGSFVLTGYDVVLSVFASRFITADLGSFTLTGQDTIFRKGLSMLASVGSLVLTGFATSLRIGFGMLAPLGSFVTTWQTFVVNRTSKIIMDFGSFTLTGQDILLKVGKLLQATYASFILSGQDTFFRLAWNIQAIYGQIVLTGQTAILKYGRILQALYGSFLLSGQDILLKLSLIMQATYTSFALTMQDIIARYGKTMSAVYGQFTLTGQSIIFHITVRMIAVYAQFTLTGQNVLFALNGLYVKWTNQAKNAVATFNASTKSTSTWINRNKNL